jgi:hypothetical protein
MCAWKRRSPITRAVAIAAVVVLTACASIFGPEERVAIMDIAPQRVDCVGMAPQECFRVREHPDTNWTLFYDGIEGFEFEAGFEYTLRVGVRPIRNPPADGSSVAYRLLAILRKVPA